ncbi:SDR family oxidoreductase [Mycobacterium sp. 1423905.2]|uniref:SDR family oxidoreductase n=1 Tax=Mycobacterium sp. 1423905.2 TaxID=1856859 RepID=UPI0007FEA059|nr:SDR family oxidoreductase [Mycobacterium sp. 1423905.2]OBJ50867.1 short chain dehydrogenase [Mycobacterium sp. 1423905.2]
MPTALITGASGGIGSAIAAALAPTHSLLLAGRPSARLDAVAERLDATTFPMDLTDTDSIESSCEVIDELDVLVHNAGLSVPGRVGESHVDEWRATFAVNVFGAVALTLALLPALRQAKGSVVFINSGSGRNVSPGMASYSASKFALRAFADSLRQDEPALRVTSIHPGRVDTEMQRDLVAYEGGDYDPNKFLRPQTIAETVAQVVATPPDGHVHEVVIRQR